MQASCCCFDDQKCLKSLIAPTAWHLLTLALDIAIVRWLLPSLVRYLHLMSVIRLNLTQYFCCFIFMLNFVDLEDIQRKRKKQIPNFTIPDGFANSTGLTGAIFVYVQFSVDECHHI